MEKLKPCPFCGKNAILIWEGKEYYNSHGNLYAYCGNCYAGGPIKRSQKEAIRAWNRREKDET